MSLRRAVAVPYRQKGRHELGESEFVVALSLDREWFTPDQAKRLVDVAVGEGLLSRDEDTLGAEFDPDAVDVPTDFEPDESVLRERSTFERALDALTAADLDKQAAVADVNALQAELDVTVETAAVLYARRRGIEVEDVAERAIAELCGETDGRGSRD